MRKLFKSIRWRLQIWYGLILVVVLAGFGFTAFQLERGRQLRRVDDESRVRIAALFRVLRGPQPQGGGLPPRDGGLPGDAQHRPPPQEDPLRRGPLPPEDELPRNPPPQDGPQPGRPFGDGNPGRNPPPRAFSVPAEEARFYDGAEPNSYYYIVWTRDGHELSRSANAPVIANEPPRAGADLSTDIRMRGEVRESFQFTPPGECVLVGRSIGPDLAELRRLAWLLTGVGGAVLLLGLAGGWWMATRTIQPIEEISATAVKIAAGDLSQRINATDTDNELGRLASVLNSTFARLEAAFAQQGRFTSDVAHELRTPVSVILTQTQTTLNRDRTAPEYRETVEACQRAAQRMRRLITSMLELARLDAGQEQMKRMRFDLSATTQDCLELIRPLAEERGIAIHGELPVVECAGDPERLAQVITNLLTNAIQYNNHHGEVRVTAQQQDGIVLLVVADTGKGIAAEELPHVFERFFRADKSRTGASGNAGLGLAISKAIVEAHSGTIEVSSKPGMGATFTIRLPAGAVAAAEPVA
ncbi:MAG: hypothetical protein JWR19_2007 [Pedosphaera sp.]|nr:hypothetical protein [Pedosphaera sp.]